LAYVPIRTFVNFLTFNWHTESQICKKNKILCFNRKVSMTRSMCQSFRYACYIGSSHFAEQSFCWLISRTLDLDNVLEPYPGNRLMVLRRNIVVNITTISINFTVSTTLQIPYLLVCFLVESGTPTITIIYIPACFPHITARLCWLSVYYWQLFRNNCSPISQCFLYITAHGFSLHMAQLKVIVNVIHWTVSKTTRKNGNNKVSKWRLLCPPYSGPDRECITKVCKIHKNIVSQ